MCNHERTDTITRTAEKRARLLNSHVINFNEAACVHISTKLNTAKLSGKPTNPNHDPSNITNTKFSDEEHSLFKTAPDGHYLLAQTFHSTGKLRKASSFYEKDLERAMGANTRGISPTFLARASK